MTTLKKVEGRIAELLGAIQHPTITPPEKYPPKLGMKGELPKILRAVTYVVPFDYDLDVPQSLYNKLRKATPIQDKVVPLDRIVCCQRFVFLPGFLKWVEAFREKRKVPPVLGVPIDGNRYFILDGTHRCCAAWSTGQKNITVRLTASEPISL